MTTDDPDGGLTRHARWCEEMRSRIEEEENMEKLIADYEAAGWTVEYSDAGAVSFSKPVTPLKFVPKTELLPEEEPGIIWAVVRGLGGKIKNVFRVRKKT